MKSTKEETVEDLAVYIILDDLHEKKDENCSSRYAKLYAKFLHASTRDAKENHE